MTSRRYLAILTLLFVGLSALTVGINYLVDPYLMLGTERKEGFNDIKVDIGEHVRLSKAYHPTNRSWTTLLIGNSRVEMGLNPNHACFKKANANVYNMGIPGASVRLQLEYALNVMHAQPISRVYLSLDYVDFLTPSNTAAPNQNVKWDKPTGRLKYTFDGSPNPEHQWQSLIDRYRSVYSLDASKSSLRTTMLQKPGQANRDEHGFNHAHDFARAVELEGPAALFTQKMASLQTQYAKPWSLYYQDNSLTRDFDAVREFLSIARQLNVDVVIFTNPFHQQFWDLLERNQLLDSHQVWLDEIKRLVIEAESNRTATNTEGNSAAPEFIKMELWDFSADSAYIHEVVPNAGVRSKPLDWFWEPSHYRKELGALMLNTMLEDSCGSTSEFGKKLH